MVGLQALKQHGLKFVVSIAILAMLIFAWYIESQKENQTITLPIVKNCKLQTTSCKASLPIGGALTFEISPKNPTPSNTLDLDVHLENIDTTSVRIKFNGKTMNMGYLEYDLKPKSKSEQTAHYSGLGGLSVCILGKMEWVVTVSILIDDIYYEVPFEMDTFYYERES